MNIAIGLALGIFLLLWIWIALEIKNAPEYDENGMPVRKSEFDITEDDIVGDLDCIYKGDEKED